MEKLKKINKKGQATSIIIFVLGIIALIIIAPIMLKIFNSTVPKFSDAVASQSPVANQTGQYIYTKTVSLWDSLILLGFVANVLLLLISSFLVDVHPAFFVVYLISAILTLIFAPDVLESIKVMWDNPQFATQTASLTMTRFIIDNFGVIILGILILSGIIMYAKFKLGGRR